MPKLSEVPRPSKLQQILILGRNHWDHDGYDADSRRAFRLALQCKTPELGGRVFGSGKEEWVFYNTCKSPACPSCGHWATIQWQRERWCAIPDVPYLGITFTMPNTLWPLFARNPRLCRKLPEIAGHVIGSYARVRYGVEVGVMPILHTFNGKLQFNSHVHALITGGGLKTSSSAWRLRIFFVRDDLMRAWQRLVIAILRGALEAGQLESGMANGEIERLIQSEEKRGWIGHVQAFDKKEHFLRYAGRYARRPPIAQRRILTIVDGFVLFWYRDKRQDRQYTPRCTAKDKRRHRWPTEQCTIEEFIDRWSQHIPKRYRHAVRHFGLFAPRRWGQVATAIFATLGTKQRPRPKRRPWAASIQQQFGRNPLLDHNGGRMKFVRHRAPAAV